MELFRIDRAECTVSTKLFLFISIVSDVASSPTKVLFRVVSAFCMVHRIITVIKDIIQAVGFHGIVPVSFPSFD